MIKTIFFNMDPAYGQPIPPCSSRLLLCLAIVLLAGCGNETGEEYPPPAEITLEEQFYIAGGDGGDGAEPLLASVEHAASSPGGDIYIYDSDSHRVLKYGPKGQFLLAFGRQGAGPAEFEQVTHLYADSRGRLVVADRGNSRISVFDGEGNMLLNQPQLRIRAVRDIKELPDGRFLVSGWHADRERFLHIFPADFSRIASSFGSLSDATVQEDERILNAIRNSAGHVAVLEEGRVAFAPARYSGRLLIYERGTPGKWDLSGIRNGYYTVENPVSMVSGSAAEMNVVNTIPPANIISIEVSNQNLTVVYEQINAYGLFVVEGGNLVHFYHRFGEEETEFVMENFDPETGELRRYGRLSSGEDFRMTPHWMDRQGSLYLSRADTLGLQIRKIGGLY